MKLNISDIERLYEGIQLLNAGRQRVIRRNNADDVITEPFKLAGDDMLRFAIAENATFAILRDYNNIVQKKLRELAPGGAIENGTPQAVEYVEFVESLRSSDHDIRVDKVHISALKADEQPFPPAIVARLLPMLDFG